MIRNILFVLLVAFTASCTNEPAKKEEKKAKTLGINMSDLDTSVSPCEDFFAYVAGGWIENNPIPETEARWGNFNILVEENNKKVRGLLDSISEKSELEKGSYKQLVSDFYKSAMDSMAVEEAGTKPLQPIFGRIEKVQSQEDFADLMVYYKLHGLKHPFWAGVSVDDKDSEAHIFEISQSGLGLPDRDYYLKSDSSSASTQAKYREHIAEMLVLSGMKTDKSIESAKAIYDFENRLAEAQMSRVDRRVPENVYNKMTRKDIVALAPVLGLGNYFDKMEVSFDSANVSQVEYMKSLNNIIKETPVETLKDYARWHAVSDLANYLPYAFVQANFDFYGKTLRGSKKLKPRWRRTMNVINEGLGQQLGHLFVDRYFPESSKEEIEAMVEDLRTAYRERIKSLEWMGDSTKQKALEKLEAFNYKIGYPDKWKDYSDLDVSTNNYFGNAWNVSRYTIQENLDKLNQPVDKDEWFMPPHIVNAYYSGSYNEIVFPAGILQPPFYDANADDAVNYGAIGGVIGHEFTHGFDDRGRKYNAFGNLANWWKKADVKRFEQRTDRMVKQYSGYQPLDEVFVNGQLTLGENIADLGGLTLAYHAYENSHVNGDDEPDVIQGYTWEQRIFLGWGRVWQTNQTDEYTSNQVMTDSHSPGQYRVNGPMSNMPEFREAWGCSEGDPMVRPDSLQVVIW